MSAAGPSAADRELVAGLAARLAARAGDPVMAARRAEWERHHALRPGRPMLLVFPEGAWRELAPDAELRCEHPGARRVEAELRRRLHHAERIGDDAVVEAAWPVEKVVHNTGWGLEPRQSYTDDPTGSWGFLPTLSSAADVQRLRWPDLWYDAEETGRALAFAHDLVGPHLRVELVGLRHVSFHLLHMYSLRRGLEQTYADLVENPKLVHAAMEFFTTGLLRLMRQYEDLGLLTLNNDGTYHSTGGFGYTETPLQPDTDPRRVRLKDLWASAESQEMAAVSPAMHEEFAMRYERRLLEPFALNGYGCCEPLDHKMDRVLALPRVRRVSVSPFADVGRSAAALGRRAICSWKPSPMALAGRFDPARIEADLRTGVAAANGCQLEVILKDTHTCAGEPDRFPRWVEIARRVLAEVRP